MKKLLKIALILLISAFSILKSCDAAILSESFLKEEIINSLKDKLEKTISGELEISIDKIPSKDINVPDGLIRVETSMNNSHFSPRTVVRVKISVDGQRIKSLGVPVEFKVKDYVWVAKDFIGRDKAFNSSNIQIKKVDVTKIATKTLKQDFKYGEYLASKGYKPGEVLNRQFIKRIPDVLKSSIVSVIFKTSNVKLVLDAEAMENGKIGDYIRVKNKKYNKFYTGKIISANQVLVKI